MTTAPADDTPAAPVEDAAHLAPEASGQPEPSPAPGTTIGAKGLVYSTRPRPMTVVWGAVLLLAGVALVAWAFGARFDLLIAGSVVLAVAGLALIASAVGSSIRSRDRT